ncbi:general stress protein [Gordoniibacillus kamchatkensis]|uniref:General stress protein n=1 Tax=Gordoniibacillus kamchatkensis TaxID=1590651 RepID=A0ABR5AJS1_9BACL|nr:Dps family protein [Paenibacillus sp. VKM B-2647]KIL41294.1 general stress protein [Paenibacillus sp. VKM B-2647]
MTQTVTDVLAKQIANWSVLYVKLHNFHWYVKGNQFFTLHLKFEELYNEAAAHIDELAERLLAIRGNPPATMREYLELSSIKEATGGYGPNQMVEALVRDFETVVNELKDGMKMAQSAGDETTADMLLAIHTSLEKHRWMLSSFLE